MKSTLHIKVSQAFRWSTLYKDFATPMFPQYYYQSIGWIASIAWNAKILPSHLIESEKRLRDVMRTLQTYPGHDIVPLEPHLSCLYHPMM